MRLCICAIYNRISLTVISLVKMFLGYHQIGQPEFWDVLRKKELYSIKNHSSSKNDYKNKILS